MSDNPIRLKILFNKYTLNQLTPAEQEEFWSLMAAVDEKDLIDEELKALWQKERTGSKASDSVNWERVETRLFKQMSESEFDYDKFKVKKMQWWKYAAAAVFIAVMVFTGKQIWNNKQEVTTVAKADVKAPDKNRATIRLNTGQIIYLDSANKGALAMQNDVVLKKLGDGSIAYNGKGYGSSVIYNTLTNPKGSKVIDMTLADGSRVWLNAGSTLTFPVVFVGESRKVSITGEAYFEVAHNASMPFTVSKGETEVTVLGTHFNVNAYEDESDIKVTLLEGSVRVNKGNATAMLKPGQQGIVSPTNIDVLNDVDTEQAMAWKNGQFSFSAASVEQIMRTAEKWYDVDVVMDQKIAQGFSFSVDRTKPISALLHAMEISGGVHFEIDGKTVHVRP